MSEIFNKIFVNDLEINESELVNGKYQLPSGETRATVKFQLKDPTTIPDVFYNNSQIKKIILGETITTIPDNAFYGTDIPEEDKASIIALKANAFEPKNQEPEFIPTTYYFISYGDKNGENKYATGQVQTINDTKIFDSVIYQGVNVINNSDDTFVIDNPYYIISSAQTDNNQLYQLYNSEGTALGIYVKIYMNGFPEQEPEYEGLWYIGTTLPTDENISNLPLEDFEVWTAQHPNEFDLGLSSPTECYLAIPKNNNNPTIIDPNGYVQQYEKLESITDYDIYMYELGNLTYRIFFE